MKRAGEQPYYTTNRLSPLSSPVTLSTKIKCDEGGREEGGEPEMDIGVATNGHYVFSLGTLTRSLPPSLTACLVARPARSVATQEH